MLPLLVVTALLQSVYLKTRRANKYCGTLFTVLLISLMLSWFTRSRLPRFFADIFFKGQKVDPESEGASAPYVNCDGFFRYLQKLPRVLYETSLVNHVSVLVIGLGASALRLYFVKQVFFPSSTTPQCSKSMYGCLKGMDIRATNTKLKVLENPVIGARAESGAHHNQCG